MLSKRAKKDLKEFCESDSGIFCTMITGLAFLVGSGLLLGYIVTSLGYGVTVQGSLDIVLTGMFSLFIAAISSGLLYLYRRPIMFALRLITKPVKTLTYLFKD